jgi:hypothetical protein
MKLNGAGKYDTIATSARAEAKADGVMLIVFGGQHGPGFSAQLPAHILIRVPEILRDVANQIERQMTES